MDRRALVAASAVAHRTLVNFELGASQPRAVTLNALRTALESAGIEFLDGEGVRRAPEKI
jgi:hypothetical protein